MRIGHRALAAAMALVSSVGVATGSSVPAAAPVTGKDHARRWRMRAHKPGTGRFKSSQAEQDRRLDAALQKRQRRRARNLRIAYAQTLKVKAR